MSRNPISRLPGREALRWLVRLLLLDKLVSLLARVLPSAPWRYLTHWPPVARIYSWWGRQGKLTRRFVVSLMLGIVIETVLLFLHGHRWLEETEDAAIDWVMQLQRGTVPTKPALPLKPFVVLDIDEPTYQSWKEPLHIPRDRLLKLIDYAVRGGAALVVVDVDLSRPGHDRAADAALRDYLAHYGGPRAPPILLVRTFRKPLSQKEAVYPAVRRSFLEVDPAIARSPLIHWGSSLFALDTDGTLRRWRLWHPACADGAPTMVPSLQLLAVCLVGQPKRLPKDVIDDVHSALRPLAPNPCDEKAGGESHRRAIKVCGLSLSAEPKGLAQRIIYTLP